MAVKAHPGRYKPRSAHSLSEKFWLSYPFIELLLLSLESTYRIHPQLSWAVQKSCIQVDDVFAPINM